MENLTLWEMFTITEARTKTYWENLAALDQLDSVDGELESAVAVELVKVLHGIYDEGLRRQTFIGGRKIKAAT